MSVAPIPFEREPDRRGERLSGLMLQVQEALDGRYVLQRKLGKGGMGVVYLAWEIALQRLVALKILPPALASEGRRERFLKEARIAAQLEHDHIVPIYAVGEAGSFVYYAMGYIRGQTLAQRIEAEGALPVADVTRILHDVARAVQYAHEQGVVHRDLKPHNILLERASGRAYVADFGLARVIGDGIIAGGGGGGGLFGTVRYMSPEQAAGLPADHRSDVYSLGVVGYVMATGRPLFEGSLAEVLDQHVSRPAPPLHVFGRHLDTTLARAVRRCLLKDPHERFQCAGELASALSQAPELRSDLPGPLRDFVARLKLESRSAAGGVLLGMGSLLVLGGAIEAGHWRTAAGALGFLVLLAASPVVGALRAARRLLRQGYARADIVHALNMDLDRQREQLAARWGSVTDATATWVRRVTLFAASLFGLGTLAALLDARLPGYLVGGGIIIGALGTVLGGSVLVWLQRRRNLLTGHRWLRFWHSRLGEWAARLAGIGLGPRPGALPPQPEPVAVGEPAESAWPPRPSGNGRGAAPDLAQQLADMVDRTESCITGICARLAASPASVELEGRSRKEQLESEEALERQLAVLEALLDKLRESDPISGVPGSMTADLAAAREICETVEALLEGREWGV